MIIAGRPTLTELRYSDGVTTLLDQAIKQAEALSGDEQDMLASQILAAISDDEKWERSLSGNPGAWRTLAEEALAEHKRGETRPIDELLG